MKLRFMMIAVNRKICIAVVAFLLAVCMKAQTVGEVRRELIRQGVPHAEVVLAQARLESGNFKSRRAREDHNILGIKHNRRYAKYKRWQECVADYKKCISSRYRKGEDYYSFLQRIGYASDKKYIQKVKEIQEERKCRNSK